MTSIPLFGGLIEQAMKQDPTVPDMSSMVLFMAKGVELAESSASQDNGTQDEENPCDEPIEKDQDSGWL